MEIKEAAEKALMKMQSPNKMSGFEYIKEAVYIINANGIPTRWGDIYVDISKKFKTTPCAVERSIRYLLNAIRVRGGDPEVVEHYIGFDYCGSKDSVIKLYRTLKQENKFEFREENLEEYIRKIVRNVIEREYVPRRIITKKSEE